MKAPFPWFGGKSRVADLVWDRFGNVQNYVEPFFGSGAVLLARPHIPQIETVNDKDGFISNFWRAVKHAPDAVAEYADWPVSENDLHARHAWLRVRREELTSRLEGNPDYYDAKIAGWWVWGLCLWIGGGWCSDAVHGPWVVQDGQLVHLGDAGRGINRKLVHLGDAGRGINRKLVHLGNAGRGINRKLVHLGNVFAELSNRLRNVRICSGDWSRVCGPSPTVKLGVTGVFLDPPYSADADRDGAIYAMEDLSVANDVRKWASEQGDNPLMRIALCGYEGEHAMPDTWECVAWKARGGYGTQGNGRGRENAGRERVWFSPHCVRPPTLFSPYFSEILPEEWAR